MDLVRLHFPQLPLLLAGLEHLAGGDVVLVRVPLQEVLPLVIDGLVHLLTTIQTSKSLQKLPISDLVVLQEGPGVDIVGGGPEARLLVAVSLPVLPGVSVPVVGAVRSGWT